MPNRRTSRRSASPRSGYSNSSRPLRVSAVRVVGIDVQPIAHPRDGRPSITAQSVEPDGPQTGIFAEIPEDTFGSMVRVGVGTEGIRSVVDDMLFIMGLSTAGRGRMVVRIHPDPNQEPEPVNNPPAATGSALATPANGRRNRRGRRRGRRQRLASRQTLANDPQPETETPAPAHSPQHGGAGERLQVAAPDETSLSGARRDEAQQGEQSEEEWRWWEE